MGGHPNGRMPPPPRQHSNNGTSGKTTRAFTLLAVALFGVPALLVLASLAWIVVES